MALTTSLTTLASKATPRNGFGGASTVWPALSSSRITPANPDASAKAPWTRTTVGPGMGFSLGVGEATPTTLRHRTPSEPTRVCRARQDVVRIYGIRHWTEQGYDQLKDELGWATSGSAPGPRSPDQLSHGRLRLAPLRSALIKPPLAEEVRVLAHPPVAGRRTTGRRTVKPVENGGARVCQRMRPGRPL